MKRFILLLSVLAPAMLGAHPGHGPVDNGMAHYLLAPIHIVGIAAVLLLVVVLYKYYKSNKRHA